MHAIEPGASSDPRALILRRLRARFPACPETYIASEIDRQLAVFASARVRQFIPVLVERRVANLVAARSTSPKQLHPLTEVVPGPDRPDEAETSNLPQTK